jgi:importin subunit alpha-6/7
MQSQLRSNYRHIFRFLSSTYTLENFNELLQSINSDDILRQHYGLIGIRKILSIADNPPIQPVIDAGLVPKMIEYVKQLEYPQLQL